MPEPRGLHLLDSDVTAIGPQLAILFELYRDQSFFEIKKKFSGGHRNRGVYLVRSSGEAERIVKIARSGDIRAELRARSLITRFSQHNGSEYVRDVQDADDSALGGIVYRLAQLRRDSVVENLADFYAGTPSPNDCAQVVERILTYGLPHSHFREVQRRSVFSLHAVPQHVLEQSAELVQTIPALSTVTRKSVVAEVILDHQTVRVRNPLDWVEQVMPQYTEQTMPVYCGVIHGDLHSGNILIERPGTNLWIIDFAKTRADAHTLTDFAKLEADLKFYLLPAQDDGTFWQRALALERELLMPATCSELGALALPVEQDTDFAKAAACIGALRLAAHKQHRTGDEQPAGHFVGDSVLPYYVALLHATLRAFTYEQCSHVQKTFAFLSAGLVCERLEELLNNAETGEGTGGNAASRAFNHVLT
jgi:hypothetical protein